MTLYQEIRLVLGQLFRMGYADCAWANCWHLAGSIALLQSAVSVPISAQLQYNQIVFFDDRRLAQLRLGRLLAFGAADCLGKSAVRLPSSAQQQPNQNQPCLERLLSLG